MSCNVYQVEHEHTSPRFCKAFARGCGGTIKKKYDGGSWAGFGSPQLWQDIIAAKASGSPFYYGDHAYFQRGKYYRITKDAFFHTGNGVSDGQRLRNLGISPAPWKKSGSNIIICPQSEVFFQREGLEKFVWLADVIEKIRAYSDRKIIIHGKTDSIPLSHYLNNAHAVVVYSSNSAVEALMNGVPAFALAPCPATNFTLSDLALIEKPLYPDNRDNWAGVLADNQWTLDEIENGTAWRKLNEKI